jgi:hypothetical protein
MEIALDFAINCSPDHPYVRDHQEWFPNAPATINAPKIRRKIRRCLSLKFRCANWRSVEGAERHHLFWADHGVDLPGTIRTQTGRSGNTLSAGCTNVSRRIFYRKLLPARVMKALAKAGF